METKQTWQTKRSTSPPHSQPSLAYQMIMLRRIRRTVALVVVFVSVTQMIAMLHCASLERKAHRAMIQPISPYKSSISSLLSESSSFALSSSSSSSTAATTAAGFQRSVFLWPFDTQGPRNTEIWQIAYNGIVESQYLKFTNDSIHDPDMIWIGDAGEGYWYGWYPYFRNHVFRYMMRIGLWGNVMGYDRTPWCGHFLNKIRHAKRERQKLGLSLSWPIYIVDMTDYASVLRCPEIEHEMGPDSVFYGIRSIVQGRYFSKQAQWTHFGRTIDFPSSFYHMPLIVRTDTIQTLEDVLMQNYNKTLAAPIERLERSIDVSHFWPNQKCESYKYLKGSRSKLRSLVNDVITEMGEQHSNINVFVGLVGANGSKGRYGVDSAYIDALLNTKITVVTQPDRWEDHYRLYEALATGGMVITDRMLSLPRGLQNGTSIIECTSREELKSQILYYLSHPEERIQIARQGRLVAMSQHRSWHRMEEMIFGQIMTNCSNSQGDNQCPFKVHAS